MAKNRFTTKMLQAETGEPSGLFLFCDGMLLFSPMSKENVLKLAKAGLAKGVNNMAASFRAIAEGAAPHPGAPSQGEGTHGADPDHTN